MKKAIYLLPLLFLLTGCGMTNDEIIRESKKCQDAGLTWWNDGFTITCGVQSGVNLCANKDKKIVDIKIECDDGLSGCTDIYYYEDNSVCKSR